MKAQKHTSSSFMSLGRTSAFAARTAKEILRDPLSFVFCLGLPILMLVGIYALLSATAPWFSLESLTPGIAVFSNTFIMLYMALLVSRDRGSSFLTRLYTSPMATLDFLLGYALPGFVIGVGQLIICYMTAALTGAVSGSTDWIHPLGILGAIVSALPCLVFFVFAGILFGVLFSDKAAPGLSSILISAAGFLSGAWMPVETLPEGFQAVCAALPFYPAVAAGRRALALAAPTFEGLWQYILTDVAYALLLMVVTALAFRFKTRKEVC